MADLVLFPGMIVDIVDEEWAQETLPDDGKTFFTWSVHERKKVVEWKNIVCVKHEHFICRLKCN